MGTQLIANDCGRNTGKTITNGKRLIMPSVVGEWRDRRISDGGDYDVTINGERFFVGELARQESRFCREMVSQSKLHEETKILTLTALALVAIPGERIRLVTGLPVEQHTTVIKQQYIKLLSGRHDVEVNGKRSTIVLGEDDIAVGIEGGGAYWSESLYGRCFIIDLGSRTVNAVCVQQNRFRDVDSLTLNYGCLELSNVSDSPNDITAEQLARRIYADLSRRWLNIRTETVLLCGGGALLMERWLRQYYPTARMSADPIWSNAAGYYKLGMMKWPTRN